MPIVPINPGVKFSSKGQPIAPPSEPFALMAAAVMHSEGRLIQPDSRADASTPPPIAQLAAALKNRPPQ
jgi:hypothetical protein